MLFKIVLFSFVCFHPNSGHNIVPDIGEKFAELCNKGFWYVLFYAPWCNHCKNLEPIWNKLGSILYDSHVRVGKIDATIYSGLASKMNISGYPTIIFFANGQPYVYNGLRNIQELLVFADKISGPPIRDIPDSNKFLDIVNIHSDGVFFLFISGDDISDKSNFGYAHELQRAYQNAAEAIYTITYFYSIAQEVLPSNYHEILYGDHHLASESNGVRHPSGVYVFKDGRIYSFGSNGENFEIGPSLYTWARCERFKSYTKLASHDMIPEAPYCDRLVVILGVKVSIREEVDADAKNISHLVQFIALNQRDKYNERFWFGWTNDKDLWSSITAQYPRFPRLLVYSAKDDTYFAPNFSPQNATLQLVDRFLDEILANRVPKRGGSNVFFRTYRSIFKMYMSVWEMFAAQPILSSVIFGLPLTVVVWVFWNIYHMTDDSTSRPSRTCRTEGEMNREVGRDINTGSDSSWANTEASGNDSESTTVEPEDGHLESQQGPRKIHKRRNKID